LWRNRELRVGLSPERIFVSGAKSVELPVGDGSWTAALEALPEVLKGRNGLASVVLADQFVRYALLPHNEALKSADEWSALARHRFSVLHGPRADEWDVKLAQTAPSGARLACATDRTLLEGLANVFVKSNLRLASVQPFLIAAFNRIRRRVGSGSCWIVVEEPGRLTLALFLKGVWVAIRSRRCDNGGDAGWRSGLKELIERESAFLGLEESCTRVIVCAQGAFEAIEQEDFRLHALNYQELAVAGN
jgi:hypothetical protein